MAQTHPQAAVAHLHNDLELTYRLLAEPTRWRERVVEKLVIEDADYVSVTSSYQIRLPLDLVQEHLPSSEPGQPVRLLLPLTTRHKAVLLDVDLRADDGRHCAMLLKHQLARLQANYMAWVAHGRPDVTGSLPDADDMLYAISAYSPAIWNVQRAETLARRDRLLASYLSLGLGFRVTETQVHGWSELVGPVEALLADALSASERVDPRSAAVGLLRSLPYASRRPADAADATGRLHRFAALVDAADDFTRSLIASYGQRWDVIVDTVVPVDVPTKIQLRTKRPWHDDAVPRRMPWSRAGVMDATRQSGRRTIRSRGGPSRGSRRAGQEAASGRRPHAEACRHPRAECASLDRRPGLDLHSREGLACLRGSSPETGPSASHACIPVAIDSRFDGFAATGDRRRELRPLEQEHGASGVALGRSDSARSTRHRRSAPLATPLSRLVGAGDGGGDLDGCAAISRSRIGTGSCCGC